MRERYIEVDIYIQELRSGSPSSISLSHVGDISTFALGFCGGFVSFLAKFATTRPKFARLANLHLPQPDPTKRKFAKARMPDRVILFERSANAVCEPSSTVAHFGEPTPNCNKLHLIP